MSVSVAANSVLRFIHCISFKWKLLKFTQSLISPTQRFPYNSTSLQLFIKLLIIKFILAANQFDTLRVE